jgi:CRISPR-associated endoribonuclease Cas6
VRGGIKSKYINMRLHLKTTKSEGTFPFNYQKILTGTLHKWIGKNVEHNDHLSLYSFSWLNGGKALLNGMLFENGAHFFISAHDQDLIKRILKGIRNSPEIAFGLVVNEIIIQEDPLFNREHIFTAASPVFIKRTIDGREKHFSFRDPESSLLLTETLKNKLRKANIDHTGISVQFDLNYGHPKTKIIYYNKIGNKVNFCPLIIKGKSEQIQFAWNVGIGNSTGIGFGAIR